MKSSSNVFPILLIGLIHASVASNAIAAERQSIGHPVAVVEAASKPLPTEQLESVREIGRSVLAASKGTPSQDADLEAVKSDIDALRNALDRALAFDTPQLRQAAINTTGGGAARASAGASDGDTRTQRKFADVEAIADRLNRRRVQVQARIRNGNEANNTSDSTDRRFATKLVAWESQLNAALKGTPSERFAKLAELRERLRPKMLREEIEQDTRASSEAPSQGFTPSVSTIIEHR